MSPSLRVGDLRVYSNYQMHNRSMPQRAGPALSTTSCPTTVRVAVILIFLYGGLFVFWDMMDPFYRTYATGPATVLLGVRVFGLWAQIVHLVQLIVCVTMAYSLLKMHRLGWRLVLFCIIYVTISLFVWGILYREHVQLIGLMGLYCAIFGALFGLTYPHRNKYLNRWTRGFGNGGPAK